MTIVRIVLLLAVLSGAVASAAAPAPSPMLTEIRDMLEDSRTAVARLAAEADRAGPERRREIRLEVERIKAEARLDMLRIQIRYARAEGRAADAAKLQDVLERTLRPQPAGIPHRDAPPTSTR